MVDRIGNFIWRIRAWHHARKAGSLTREMNRIALRQSTERCERLVARARDAGLLT